MDLKLSLSCFLLIVFSAFSTGSTRVTIIDQDNKPVVNAVVSIAEDNVEDDLQILPYFQDSNIDRFTEKLAEQICSLTGGPCEYTGDTMEQVHAGMNISETHFNQLVDLLINAMNKANVAHTLQNQVLARLAPTRKEMLYR